MLRCISSLTAGWDHFRSSLHGSGTVASRLYGSAMLIGEFTPGEHDLARMISASLPASTIHWLFWLDLHSTAFSLFLLRCEPHGCCASHGCCVTQGLPRTQGSARAWQVPDSLAFFPPQSRCSASQSVPPLCFLGKSQGDHVTWLLLGPS